MPGGKPNKSTMGKRRMHESTSGLLANIESYPEALEALVFEEWNPDNIEEAVSGVSVADAIEDMIDDYEEKGEITLATIGKELMDIGKNNANSIREAVQALKKAGIKIVRR